MESQKKLEMAESFMNSARILEGPLSAIRTDSQDTIQDQMDKQRIHKKMVSYFLYALVFELLIKVIWEAEKGKKCRPTHNILNLYEELSYETQSQIRERYDRQAFIIKTQDGKYMGRQIHLEELTTFQSLEEALEANYNVVTDFKYDGYFQGKSSVIAGVIWNTEGLLWTLPDRFVVFPKELLEYTKRKAESQ